MLGWLLEAMLRPIPKSEELEFKPAFIERYSKLTDFEKFKEYSLAFLRRAIRVNTLKISIAELKKRLSKEWKLTQVPWCKEGFWMRGKTREEFLASKDLRIKSLGEHKEEPRRDIGNTVEHALGYFYVQEAASMLPPLALAPKPGEAVLDMCAAPGSKSSQIAALMKNKGILIANEVSGDRIASLGINLQRVGATNTVITQMSGDWFKDVEFDRILVDAPCSGTGTIRKSLKTIKIWNPNMVKRLFILQRRLIFNSFKFFKKL